MTHTISASLVVLAGLFALPFIFQARRGGEAMATELSPTSEPLRGGYFEEATFAAG